MLINCTHPDDMQVLVGRSLGIGVTVGFVCGGILVSLFFIAYRSSYIRNLIFKRIAKKKKPESIGSKNKNMVASHTSNQPEQETQRYLTGKDVKASKKKLPERARFQNKNQHEEDITNLSQNDFQNANHSSYEHCNEISPHYQNNHGQPTYANITEISNYENEYDYVTPSTIQGWHSSESQPDEDYVQMKLPDHSQWYNRGQV